MTDRKGRYETPEIISRVETANLMTVSLPTLWRIRQDPGGRLPGGDPARSASHRIPPR